MFLMYLEKDEQKKLFMQLATVVMMAEGDASTTSKLICDDIFDDYDYDDEEETNLPLFFWQSLNENELFALGNYALECRYIDASSDDREDDYFGKEEILKNLISTRWDSMGLQEIFSNQITSTIEKNKENQDFKKQVVDNFMANNGDLVNLNGDIMKSEFLKLPQLKAEVLENTAKKIIESSKVKLDEKLKKIILFELIGAGFSDGYFDDSEKNLFHKICQWLDIEEEYVDEFLELATSFFTLTNDITDLINE